MDRSLDITGPSFLFCPGDRPERFAKAVAASDMAVLDLEDGVGPDAKPAARRAVVDFLRRDHAAVMVRINHPATEQGRQDAAAVIAAGARVLLLPKTETAAEIDAVLAAAGSRAVALVATIESARGVLAMEDILARPEVAAASWGPYDLAADFGLRLVRDGDGRFAAPLTQVRDRLICVAAATGTTMLDPVTTEYGNEALLGRDLAEAVALGMIGKFAIHPHQVAAIRAAFVPSPEELDRYRRMLAADRTGGAFGFDGEMVDGPVLRRARRYLALAERYGG